jgi:hypothetical protein
MSSPRQWIRCALHAGIGGESAELPVARAQPSEALSDALGVLKLTLYARSYSWEFVPIVPGQISDAGTGSCQ